MLIKKWKTGETIYWMKANFKNRTAYTDVVKITLKEPWLIPKYEDDFAGLEGFVYTDGFSFILADIMPDYWFQLKKRILNLQRTKTKNH